MSTGSWAVPLFLLFLFVTQAHAGLAVRTCAPEPGTTTMAYGDLVNCEIEVVGDSDLFSFSGQVGDKVDVYLLRYNNNANMCFRVIEPEPPALPAYTCGHATFRPVTVTATYTVTKPGVHTIQVADGGGDEVFRYGLAIVRVLPASPSMVQYPQWGVVVPGDISPRGDTDLYTMTGISGDLVSINLSRRPGSNADMCFRLIQPDGTIGNYTCGHSTFRPPSVSADINLTQTGVHIVQLADGSFDETFPYNLTITCFGACLPQTGASVSPAGVSVGVGGGAFTLTITAPTNFWWESKPNVSWLGAASPASGFGNGQVNFTVQPNAQALPRTGLIRIAGSQIQVIQSGTDTVAPYEDVPNTHAYADQIRLMKNNAITSGCTSAAYCPDNPVTRSQMAVFIIRSLSGGDTFPFTATPYFTDVPATHPHFAHVQRMRDLGITTGCSDARYCPEDPVTRGQMAVFMIRAKYGGGFGFQAAPYFTDTGPAHPYFSFIQKMKETGITTGCTATMYCPEDPNVRGQMAVFIVRAFLTPW